MTLILSGTNGVSDIDGSAATPAIRGTDANTGIFFPAADTIAFSEGGVEAMRIDSSGNVGIGTSSPAYKLDVSGTGRVTGDFYVGSSTNIIYESSSNLNIRAANSLLFNTSGANERMRIDSSGNLLVGTTTTAALPTSTADIVAGGFALNISRRTTGIAGNTYWSPSDGYFYRSTSSLRYKINVQDYSRGLTDIAKLRPVTFNSKPKDGEKNPDTNTYAGFIAEEVHDAGLTEYVQYANDGIPESLSYANMVALLTKAIQEQQALITALTARITALEAK
jgi:hypothetical protein